MIREKIKAKIKVIRELFLWCFFGISRIKIIIKETGLKP